MVSSFTRFGKTLAEHRFWVSDLTFGGPAAELITTASAVFDPLRAASLGPRGPAA